MGGESTLEILRPVIEVDPPPKNVLIGPGSMNIPVPRLPRGAAAFFSDTHAVKKAFHICPVLWKLTLEKSSHEWVGLPSQFPYNGVVEGGGVAVGAKTTHDVMAILLEEFWEVDVLEMLAVVPGPLLVEEGECGNTVLEEVHPVTNKKRKQNMSIGRMPMLPIVGAPKSILRRLFLRIKRKVVSGYHSAQWRWFWQYVGSLLLHMDPRQSDMGLLEIPQQLAGVLGKLSVMFFEFLKEPSVGLFVRQHEPQQLVEVPELLLK